MCWVDPETGKRNRTGDGRRDSREQRRPKILPPPGSPDSCGGEKDSKITGRPPPLDGFLNRPESPLHFSPVCTSLLEGTGRFLSQ